MKKEQFLICGIDELPKFIEQHTPTHVITLAREGTPSNDAVEVVDLFDYPIIHHIEHFDDVDSLDKKYYESNEGYREIKITFPDLTHVKRIKLLSDETFSKESKIITHCSAGISRSTSMTLGLMVYNDIDKIESFKYITSIRPHHYMNSLVLKQWDTIMEFEKTDSLVYLNRQWNKFIEGKLITRENSGDIVEEFITNFK